MIKLTAALVCLFVCVLSSTALAQTKVKVATGQVWSTAFPKGEAKSSPVSTTLGLALTVPIGQNWLWYAEGGLATPNSSFYPSPRTVQGPAYKLSGVLSVGLTGAYQYSPKHGQVDWSHSAGAGLFVGANVTKEIGVTLVAGGGKSLREDGPWFICVQPRVSFTLPF